LLYPALLSCLLGQYENSLNNEPPFIHSFELNSAHDSWQLSTIQHPPPLRRRMTTPPTPIDMGVRLPFGRLPAATKRDDCLQVHSYGSQRETHSPDLQGPHEHGGIQLTTGHPRNFSGSCSWDMAICGDDCGRASLPLRSQEEILRASGYPSTNTSTAGVVRSPSTVTKFCIIKILQDSSRSLHVSSTSFKILPS
jgi:hypothetical protein